MGKRDTKWSKPKRVLLHPHMPDLHPVAGVAFLRFFFLLPWLLYLPSHSRDACNATSPLRPLIRPSSILKPSPSRARVVLSWKKHKTQDDGKVRRRDLGQGVALLSLFSGQVFFRCAAGTRGDDLLPCSPNPRCPVLLLIASLRMTTIILRRYDRRLGYACSKVRDSHLVMIDMQCGTEDLFSVKEHQNDTQWSTEERSSLSENGQDDRRKADAQQLHIRKPYLISESSRRHTLHNRPSLEFCVV